MDITKLIVKCFAVKVMWSVVGVLLFFLIVLLYVSVGEKVGMFVGIGRLLVVNHLF